MPRPKEKDPKNYRLSVRLSDAETEAITLAAIAEGWCGEDEEEPNLSGYVRAVAIEHAERVNG